MEPSRAHPQVTLELAEVSPADAGEIASYRREFPVGHMQATPDPDCIPGLDCLERFPSVEDWLRFTGEMKGKITWYLSRRPGERSIVGCLCLRHALEYDDDDPEFASHIGYSVRPSLQGGGYGREQLRLGLEKAGALGLRRVRLLCRDTNLPSSRVILANGGVLVDSIRGEESGLRVFRYDIALNKD